MASRNNLLTSLIDHRAPDLNFIDHVDQQAGHAHRYFAGGGSAGWTRELDRVGRAEGGDGRSQAFGAENMIALQAHGLDERTVAYRAHQVRIIAGDDIEGAQVDLSFLVVDSEGQEIL